jgi:hypothetical protein
MHKPIIPTVHLSSRENVPHQHSEQETNYSTSVDASSSPTTTPEPAASTYPSHPSVASDNRHKPTELDLLPATSPTTSTTPLRGISSSVRRSMEDVTNLSPLLSMLLDPLRMVSVERAWDKHASLDAVGLRSSIGLPVKLSLRT